MSPHAADLFFQYEETIELYLETRQEALRLRAIVLRRELLDEMLGVDFHEDASALLQSGQLQVPKWLAGDEN